MFDGVHKYLKFALVSAGILIVSISLFKSQDGETFYGIAESKEIIVNFDRNVVLKRLQVVSGKKVKKGELLAEFDQAQLEAQIAGAKNQVDELRAQSKLVQDLNLDAKGVPSSKRQSKNAEKKSAPDPAQLKLEFLVEQLRILEHQKEELTSYAIEDSTVGSVNFKVGENVPAFVPIITLVPQAPLQVKGYIHESVGSAPLRQQSVNVESVGLNRIRVAATVAAIGERIVSFPERLKPNADVAMWGREVVIQLPEDNPFLVGEKVLISTSNRIVAGKSLESLKTLSLIGFEEAQKSQEVELTIPASISGNVKLEPSGLLYLEDLDKFLLVSDEPAKQGFGEFFLLNLDGSVDPEAQKIEGYMGSLSDLESLSQDSFGHITAMSSQSLSKGESVSAREHLLSVSRDKKKFRGNLDLNLRNLLKNWAEAHLNQEAAKFLNTNLNIEGHFWNGGDLFLGLKMPMTEAHEALILRIKKAESLNAASVLGADDVSIWKKLALEANGKRMGISDLLYLDGSLYILSTCPRELNEGACGAFWKYGNPDQQGASPLKLIRYFAHTKPEGLAFRTVTREFVLVFDAGKSGVPTMLRLSEKALK